MSLQSQFNKFNETISLVWQDEKIKKIREKNDSILEDIKDKFKEEKHPVIETFKQGSYITNTTIEPFDKEYDMDIGIVVSSVDAPENPVKIKTVLRDVLITRNFKEPRIKKPCVTAQYYKAGEKNFHLDYPIYKKDSLNKYYLAVGKEHSSEEQRKWEETDPKGLIDWLNNKDSFDCDESYKQYKRLIRYMKRWRDYCFTGSECKKIYSIGLAVMIKKSFIKDISLDGEISDIKSLKKTVSGIKSSYFQCTDFVNNKYKVTVKLPAMPFRDIFEKNGDSVGTLFHNKLENLLKNLENSCNETSLVKQCEKLRKDVFGDDFPVPDDDKNSSKTFPEAGYIASPQGG